MPTTATHAHTARASTPQPAIPPSPRRQVLMGDESWRRRTSGALSVASTTPATTMMDEVMV